MNAVHEPHPLGWRELEVNECRPKSSSTAFYSNFEDDFLGGNKRWMNKLSSTNFIDCFLGLKTSYFLSVRDARIHKTDIICEVSRFQRLECRPTADNVRFRCIDGFGYAFRSGHWCLLQACLHGEHCCKTLYCGHRQVSECCRGRIF